jgi:signal transduction histidine kinase/CheY-like chemotaxis protein
MEATWKRKDGAAIHVRLSGRRFTLADGEVAWEAFVEDITEVTRLQAQYAQSQKMEALGRLAGGVAHDFNNLLTVVLGQAEVLREDPDARPHQRDQANEIFAAALRGAALSRQLLAFGRRTPWTKRPLNLNQVIRDFELVIRRAVGEAVQLRLALAPDIGQVHADRSRLEQIIMNLVVNAKDAMPHGGTLSVATSTAVVTPEDAQAHAGAAVGPHVLLTVSDTGTGVPEEVLPHIFEPFYSTKPATTRTGLGLATVYGIVADSGGHLRVRNEPSGGATFLVFLPVYEGEAEEPVVPRVRTRAPSKGGVILLAEDEVDVRRLAQTILERAGYEVLPAADGREALEVAANTATEIDLLVSDVVMPGFRGPQLAEVLAASGKVSRAVFVSGYPEGLTDAGPEGVSAWRFLAKPFTSAQLLEAVESVLDGGD